MQQSYTLIRCIVPSNTQADNRQGQAAAPLMICLEPSSLSLGNLEIRHGPGPGALLNADRPTHLASQAQDQARGGSPSLGRNVLDSHPSYFYAGAGRYVMGREARQHLTRQQQRPKSRIPIGLLTRSPFLQPSSSIESHHHHLHWAPRAVALFRRTNHYSGPLFQPRDSSRLSHLPIQTHLRLFLTAHGSLTLTQPSLLPIVALNCPLGTT